MEGEYFVQICALDVDLNNRVVLGSCNREHGAKMSNGATSRSSQHTKLAAGSFVAQNIRFEPTMSALSGMSVVFHVSAPFSVANSSTIAFSRNSPSSPDSAPARFRGANASSSLVSAAFASSSLESAVRSSFTASAFADAFPASRESFRHQTWVRHRESQQAGRVHWR